jgi:hypothetical protein
MRIVSRLPDFSVSGPTKRVRFLSHNVVRRIWLALYCALGALKVDLVGSGDFRAKRGSSSTELELVVSWPPVKSLWTHVSTVSIPLIETKKRKKIAFYS